MDIHNPSPVATLDVDGMAFNARAKISSRHH